MGSFSVFYGDYVVYQSSFLCSAMLFFCLFVCLFVFSSPCVLCTQCCQCLWIYHSLLRLRVSLTLTLKQITFHTYLSKYTFLLFNDSKITSVPSFRLLFLCGKRDNSNWKDTNQYFSMWYLLFVGKPSTDKS